MEWSVVTDLYDAAWRRLLELANDELAIETISFFHGPPSDVNTSRNYRKQANQIRACVLQAKEYFDAARASTIFTSPNHLYYGVVALGSVMMLVRGDGAKALDYLRRDKNNNQHGLSFSLGCNAREAASSLSLLEKSHVSIGGQGQFANWYATLPQQAPVYAQFVESTGRGQRTYHDIAGGDDLANLASEKGRKKSLLDLLRYFPDLAIDLRRYGVTVVASRLTFRVDIVGTNRTYNFALHGAGTRGNLFRLLDRFSAASSYADLFSTEIGDTATGGIVTFSLDHLKSYPEVLFRWPSSRQKMDQEAIAYDEVLDTLELVDCYLATYQLSMLSRYFPDIWVTCLDSQCKAAGLIKLAVDVMTSKIPVLALEHITPNPLVLTTSIS